MMLTAAQQAYQAEQTAIWCRSVGRLKDAERAAAIAEMKRRIADQERGQ